MIPEQCVELSNPPKPLQRSTGCSQQKLCSGYLAGRSNSAPSRGGHMLREVWSREMPLHIIFPKRLTVYATIEATVMQWALGDPSNTPATPKLRQLNLAEGVANGLS